MTPTLTLGHKNYSSWSLRPWLVLRHFGVEFVERVLPLDTDRFHAEIAAVSPSRRVPALEHGALVVWDSLAICEYANETWLGGKGWPQARASRAVARSVAAEMHSGFQALRTECPMNVRRRIEHHPISADLERDIARVRALWTQIRAAHGGGGDFLFGDFCIADAFFAPVATRFRTYALPAGEVERRYIEAMFGLPAMKAGIADAERVEYSLPMYYRAAASGADRR
jgi:glutathione S-transferase